jgi:hypothetical protein
VYTALFCFLSHKDVYCISCHTTKRLRVQITSGSPIIWKYCGLFIVIAGPHRWLASARPLPRIAMWSGGAVSGSGSVIFIHMYGRVRGVVHAFPAPREELTWEDAQFGPTSSVYRCFDMRSVTKRQPELVVQTLPVVNVCWWGFPAGGSTVVYIFGLCPRNASCTSRCRGVSEKRQDCCGGLWIASGGGLCGLRAAVGLWRPQLGHLAWELKSF